MATVVPISSAQAPQSDVEAERDLVAHILWTKGENDAGIITELKPENFYDPVSRCIWETIRRLDAANRPIEIQMVAMDLKDRDELTRIGGTAKLVEISGSCPALSVKSVREHVNRIISLWKAREFVSQCTVALVEIRGCAEDQITDVLQRHDRFTTGLITQNESNTPVRFSDAIKSTLKRLTDACDVNASPVVMKLGYPSLDRKMGGGLYPGDVTIIASRPGMGKTAMLLNTAVNMTTRPIPIPGVIFSLEMKTLDLALRILCSESGLVMNDVRQGKISAAGWQSLNATADRLAHIPLWIDDQSSISMPEIRAKVRWVKKAMYSDPRLSKMKLGLVGIDYLQLMKSSGRSQNREQEVAGISRDVKMLAKDEDVAVAALSQLNRAAEEKNNQRPGLKDLRESGAIEQDADNVIFLYRPAYYNEDEDPKAAEILIAKQRNGEAQVTVKMCWEASKMRYSDPVSGYDEFDDIAEPAGNWDP